MICYWGLGMGMGIPVFKAAWSGCGVGMIISFILVLVISKFTTPPPKEYLDKLFAKS